MFTDDNPFF
ncbi:b76ea72c-9847-4c67-95c9-7c969355d60c [Thermothielavioides terrestris]|uniref:B76ea72c-9847-4c67-95c9-7c969355d60c n=1 Tax=Thermothielavioides terrestris TaxID=2587410 RepID=A0A446BE17_9PEZI|nr:b76ea72c-9847-4c67-95c9-7c969355d60c [Thermothielavioides terrestris]